MAFPVEAIFFVHANRAAGSTWHTAGTPPQHSSMDLMSSPAAPWLLRALLLALILAALFLAALFFMQDKLILFPQPGGGAAASSREGWAVPWIENGEFLGKSYQHAGPVRGTVLVYHGNAGTIEHREALAQVLAAHGLRVVLVEYPGYGQRPGSATLSTALQGSLDAFRHARAKWDGPLFTLGESLGAGMAAQVARRYPQDVAGVALFTPWDSLYRLVNSKFYRLPVGLVLRHRLDTAAALADFKGGVAIVAAQQDTLIPPGHARALATSVPNAAYLEIAGAGHNDWLYRMSDTDWERVVSTLTGRAN